MARHIDTLPRVRLSPDAWERVEAMAARESRSVANMLGVLVAEAMAARMARDHTDTSDWPSDWHTRPLGAQKGASK